MNEQKSFEQFYKNHPEIAQCAANTGMLREFHHGDDITLQSLEESAPRLNLAKVGKRQPFEDFCREQVLSVCDANRSLYASGFNNPAAFAPRTMGEALQIRAQAVSDYTRNYNSMLRNSSPDELRPIVRQEAVKSRAAAAQSEADRDLDRNQQRDAVFGFPQLPAEWQGQRLDANFIKNCSVQTQKLLHQRFGVAQVTARLRGTA